MVPTMMLAADSSRDAHRAEALRGLADAVTRRGEAPVVSSFGSADDLRSAVEAVEGPLVVVPAYLAGSDRASAELLAGLDLDHRFDACTTAPLGAVPSIVGSLARRLQQAGWRPGDGVVLAADGTSDQDERHQLTSVARMLSRRVQSPVQVGYLSAWAPSVTDAVERLRRRGQDRVCVAAWQLVEGEGHGRLRDLDATAVTAPLWPAGVVVDTLLAQHRAATARLAA
ncbi:sirohydrochlorin chelatase [Marinitenerispora sediminis]|uniref:Cobalamin biosynthesis protein CbiX n=1 Tax=Marinitenerispora sediminis TaxID=1931232 RepID=A0A368T3K5_9ACTN|nr:CbiX/SirB N-terminal domain-containing protein [Marinitenerispora sediminis]RCV55864.1 cobalamin biosynthesis protein CbiX [Marinitenerispora sediminis]RCV57327.1 cobalamin biosynthesis protein CbiX [Marinitenerispora sediminis]RCV59415.1 cobalamin biosynthesis protein CbiX [Marinitenerispora sediminis]